MTENTTTEWTPQPCDPDAESVKPEGLREEAWDVLSDLEKHAITQHVHPDHRIKHAEVQAYVTAVSAMGISQNEALSELLILLLENSDEAFVIETVSNLVTKMTLAVGMQVVSMDPATLFEQIFGQPMPQAGEENEG